MELADVEAFLVLAEELHFGRTAERTYVSPARVSQRIQALEHEVGGTLFERTSRRVRLTPLGSRLLDELRPAYQHLTSALGDARSAAREASGLLRIGFTATTGGEQLNQLVRAFEYAHPDCTVVLREVSVEEPFDELRRGEVDVVVNWLMFHPPDLTLGPTLVVEPRMLLVATDHPLASRESVSVEDLADYQLPYVAGFQHEAAEEFTPTHTPSGRPIRWYPEPVRTANETIELVARGLVIHPTVTSLARLAHRPDVVLVPAPDLVPWSLGLIWCTAHENARIRALAALVQPPGSAR